MSSVVQQKPLCRPFRFFNLSSFFLIIMEDDADLPVITFFKEEYLDFQRNDDNICPDLKITDEDDGEVEGEVKVYLTINDIKEVVDENEESQSVLLQEPFEPLSDDSRELTSDVKVVTFGNQQYFCIPINAENDDGQMLDNPPSVQSEGIQNIKEINFINDSLDITVQTEEIMEETLVSTPEELEPFGMIVVNSIEEEEDEDETKKEFKCLYKGCEKRYPTSEYLSIHLQQHAKGKTYACPFEGCGKLFATNYSLTAHGRTHTGEKPYVCLDCGKSFKISGDLLRHKRTHTGEKPFKCPVEGCDKAFTTSNIRKVHVRSHTGERPYVCDYPNCGKAFAASTNYKNHARIHSGEKPYVCNVKGCDKKFTEYSSLYKHQAVHQTSDRTFQCEYCKIKLKSEQTLNVHRKVKHGILVTATGIKVLDLESVGLSVTNSKKI